MDGGDRDGVQADPSSGVFGNLPGSRPGTRSPRRGSSESPASDPPPDQTAAASGPGVTEPEPEPPPRGEPRSTEAPGPDEIPHQPGPEQGGGLEDLAWAGIAAAAEAATLGVRLATRAIEAVRESVDRR